MKPKNLSETSRGHGGLGLIGGRSLLANVVAVVLLGGIAGHASAQSARSSFANPGYPADSRGTVSSVEQESTSSHEIASSHENARRLLRRVITQIALGEAFDAKVRQRVWVGGREVIGVGTYEQAGDGSGRFNLQVAMHDGDGKHTLQQISDGRLAWTREQIGDEVTLRRVDVGRLDQWVHGSSLSDQSGSLAGADTPRSLVGDLPPSVRVGGFAEILERLASDYRLKLVAGHLEDHEVWIVRGSLRNEVRAEMLADFLDNEWPELCPTEAVVAIAKTPNPETQFGQGIPVRFEFWASPSKITDEVKRPFEPDVATEPDNAVSVDVADEIQSSTASPKAAQPSPGTAAGQAASSRLVSLIELYAIRPIASPPVGRFRFENQDMEVNFTNETDRYLSRYGIRITERQSRLLRR
jgi:hypothetical protein